MNILDTGRDALQPLGNGKIVMVVAGFFKWLVPIVLSVWLAYLTASGRAEQQREETERNIAVLSEREDNHYKEVMRGIEEIKGELREMRRNR